MMKKIIIITGRGKSFRGKRGKKGGYRKKKWY